jgi:hypothetical protein
VNDIDVRDLEGRTFRFIVSSGLGFPAAWILAGYLPTREGVSGGGMDISVIFAGCIVLSIAAYGLLTALARWRRHRQREQLPRAIARATTRSSSPG